VKLTNSERQGLLISLATGKPLQAAAGASLLEVDRLRPLCSICQDEGCEFCPRVKGS
jgi:hypothetical protein